MQKFDTSALQIDSSRVVLIFGCSTYHFDTIYLRILFNYFIFIFFIYAMFMYTFYNYFYQSLNFRYVFRNFGVFIHTHYLLRKGVYALYDISYLWAKSGGIILTMSVAIVISLIMGK